MLLVEKIGGTSMSRFADVLNNIVRNGKSQLTHRILVVSAYAGVTNWLLEDKKTGASGAYQKFAEQKEKGWEASLDEIAFEPPRTDPSLRGFPEAARAAVREEILAVERELEKRIRTRVLAVVKEWMEKRPEERGRT